MGLWIASNPEAFQIWAFLEQDNQAISGLQAHIASGQRIMSAADDPAGLGISQTLTAQINGSNQAYQNVQDVSSLLSTADGAMGGIQTTLQSMYTLAVAAASGALSASQISADQTQLYDYSNQINGVANSTSFNGHELLDGGANAPNDNGWSAMLFTAVVGANPAFDTMAFTISTMTSSALGILSTQISVSTVAEASQTMIEIQNAINQVSSNRGTVGGDMNALGAQLSVLQVQSQNLQAANGNILNLDVAQASAQLASEQLLASSAVAMLAQANSAPENLLSLLGLPATAPSIA